MLRCPCSSFQVKRCFEELFFLGARDRVGATVLETRVPAVDAPPPTPPAVAPQTVRDPADQVVRPAPDARLPTRTAHRPDPSTDKPRELTT